MKKLLSVLLSLALVLGVCGGLSSTAFAADSEVVTVQYQQTEARKMLSSINRFRASGSWCWNESDTEKISYPAVQALQYDYDLEKSAMIRAAEISVYFDHIRPNGQLPFTTYTYYGTAGENIAYIQGYTNSAETVFEMWKEENENYDGQGHRRNMLKGDFGAVGIACCNVNGIYYWVQEFRDVVVEPNATPANNGYANVTIDYTGNVKPTLVGVKAPAVKAPTIKLTSPKKRAFKVSWNAQANVKNYQIQYSYSKKFKNAKKLNVNANYGSMTVSGKTSKKRIYVRVRAKNNATGKYSKWSKTKSVKIK